MAIIQNLVAMFRADSSAFESGTKRASKSLSLFNNDTKRTKQSLYDLQVAATQSQRKFSAALLMMGKVGGAIYLGQKSLGVAKRVLVSSVKEFADFEKNMGMVSTMLDDQSMKDRKSVV